MEANRNDNDPRKFHELPPERQRFLLDWITDNLTPRKTWNDQYTSYGLKHIVQRMTGEYFTNGEFKGAMLEAGYQAKDPSRMNWVYGISEKSPGIIERKNNYPNAGKTY